MESHPLIWQRDRARGYEPDPLILKLPVSLFRTVRHHLRLPVGDVVGLLIGGNWPPIARGEILQQLNAWGAGGAQGSDSQMSAEDVVQVLLLGSVVLARPTIRKRLTGRGRIAGSRRYWQPR